MNLYSAVTKLGNYWVIAKHPTEAQDKVAAYFDKANYGSYENRKVTTITLVAENSDNPQFIINKNLVL